MSSYILLPVHLHGEGWLMTCTASNHQGAIKMFVLFRETFQFLTITGGNMKKKKQYLTHSTKPNPKAIVTFVTTVGRNFM